MNQCDVSSLRNTRFENPFTQVKNVWPKVAICVFPVNHYKVNITFLSQKELPEKEFF